MKIGMKLGIAFAALTAIIIILVYLGISTASTLNDSVQILAKDRFPKTVWANNIIDVVNEGALSLRNALLAKDPKERDQQIERTKATTPKARLNLDSLTATIKSEKGIKLLAELNEVRNTYIKERNMLFDLIAADSKDDAVDLLFGDFRKTQNAYLDKLNEIISFQGELFNESALEAENTFNSQFNLLLILGAIALVLAITLSVIVTKGITKPINTGVNVAEEIARGNTNVNVEVTTKDETAILLNAMKSMATIIKNIITEVNTAARMASDGKLDYRADATKYQGDYKELMLAFNSALDALIKPINVTAEYVDRISKGDMPPKITDEYKGDFNEIKNNLNGCIDAVNALIKDANFLAKAAVEGKLDTRADASKHQGDFRAIVQGVNDTLDAVIGPLNVAAEYVDRISKGDMPPKITKEYNGDFNEIKNNLNGCIDAINALIKDAFDLSDAAVEGRILTRADSSKHQGDFRKIIDGVNETINSLVGLLDNMPAPCMIINKDFEVLYMNKAGAGLDNKTGEQLYKTRTKCWDHFKTGDCHTNNCACKQAMQINGEAKSATVAKPGIHTIDIAYTGVPIKSRKGEVIGAFEVVMDQTAIKNAERLSQKIAAYQEKETEKVTNYLIEISKGNVSINPVTEPADSDTEDAKSKFDKINGAIKQTVVAIKNLIDDSLMLSQAAAEGRLDTRADAAKHQGDFRKIVEGVNETLDNVIGPLNVAAEYVDRIAKGDIPPKITKEYKGDFNEIKNNLNMCIDAVDLLVKDAKLLATAAAEGRLDTRADASKHQGDFRAIVEGVNSTLDNVIGPINEASEVLSILASGDLRARVKGEYKGDLSKLKNDINQLADSLAALINEVNNTVSQVASAATQISATSDSLAAATQEQSAQTDDVASAVEEMSRTITENAMGATRTAEVAQKNGELANQGGSVVQQTVQKMKDIANVVGESALTIQKLGESSKQIGEIIAVIDDIADQTNLLALNAAIEAARAGEQGRGFAVVADEVRKLAERTTDATKQIANMIRGIQKETDMAVEAMNQGNQEVQKGIDLADRAGQALRDILNSTKEVLEMINQIAAASEEQSATSEEISKNVLSISKVISESSRRVEDVAHASDDMAKLTERLRNLMMQFKVGGGDMNFANTNYDTRTLGGGASKRQLASGSVWD